MLSIKDKLIKNTVYNSLGHIWTVLVAIALTPYIIKHIGIEGFGIWVIIAVVTRYFGLLDFSLGNSFVKFISEYYTKGDYKSLNDVVNTGFVFYLLFSSAVTTLFCLLIRIFIRLFHIPADLYSEAIFVFVVGILLFALSNTLKVFPAVCDGLQRMDITNKVGIGSSFVWILGTIFSLQAGYGLRGLIVSQLLSYLVFIIIIIGIAYRILPQLKFSPFSISKKMFKRLFSFGAKLQVSRFAELINFQMDKILISCFLGIGLVTFYELGSKITLTVRSLPLLLTTAIVPAASELEAKKDTTTLYQLYLRASKYLVLSSIPLAFFVILTAPFIMLVWIGPGYANSTAVIQLLGLGYLANMLTGVIASMVQGIGKPELLMRQAFVQALLNIILSIILIIKFGFFGAVLGTTFSLLVGAVYFFILFHRFIKRPIVQFLKEIYLGPLSAALLCAILTYVFNLTIRPFGFSASRLINLGILITEAIVFAAIYISIVFALNYLDRQDKLLLYKLYRYLPILRSIRAKRYANQK